MSEKVILGLLQISSGPSREKNLEKMCTFLEQIEDAPDILITPEYFGGLKNGKINKNLIKRNAISGESNYINRIKEKVEELGSSILFTTYRKNEEGYFNSAIFLNEEGEMKGIYDKIHLFDALGHKESLFFRRGREITVFEWRKYKIGIAICFDLRFPEIFNIMRSMGADIVLIPSGWYPGTHKYEQWSSLISVRAHENNFFVVGVNQPKPYFIGKSMVSSPLGYKVKELGKEESIKLVDIDMKEINKSKRNLPIEKLKQFDIYKNYNHLNK